MAAKTLPANFDLLSVVGRGNSGDIQQANSIQLIPGQTTKFIAANGTEAGIKVDELRLIRFETVNYPNLPEGIIQTNQSFFFQGAIVDGDDKLHPYCGLAGYSTMAKEIRTQLWRTAKTAGQKMYDILADEGWSMSQNLPPRNGSEGYGRLVSARPLRPSDGNMAGYGLPVESLTISSNWTDNESVRNGQDGFRDFWTSQEEMYQELLDQHYETDQGIKEALAELGARHRRFVLGGRMTEGEGWPKQAQVNHLKLAGHEYIDLWSTGVRINLDNLLAASAAKRTPVALTPENAPEEEPAL